MWSPSIMTSIARRARAALRSTGACPMRVVAVGQPRIASATRWASPAPRDGTFIILARPMCRLAPITIAGALSARRLEMLSAPTDQRPRRSSHRVNVRGKSETSEKAERMARRCRHRDICFARQHADGAMRGWAQSGPADPAMSGYLPTTRGLLLSALPDCAREGRLQGLGIEL